jgi:hypothetical protein
MVSSARHPRKKVRSRAPDTTDPISCPETMIADHLKKADLRSASLTTLDGAFSGGGGACWGAVVVSTGLSFPTSRCSRLRSRSRSGDGSLRGTRYGSTPNCRLRLRRLSFFSTDERVRLIPDSSFLKDMFDPFKSFFKASNWVWRSRISSIAWLSRVLFNS